MTYQEIKSFINTYIVQNGVNSITGARLNTALNALADYYGFDSVVVTTLPAGSDATANVQGKTLELGIPKGEKGADGVDGRDGSDAVNPFKGWFKSLDDLKDSYIASVGDSAYVKDASPSTTWSIYVYDSTASSNNYWADSGTDADTSNVQTFASSQQVNDVHIVNDFSGGEDDVASAETIKILKNEVDTCIKGESINLFDKTKLITGYYINSSGVPMTGRTNAAITALIPIKANTIYAFSVLNSAPYTYANNYIRFVESDGVTALKPLRPSDDTEMAYSSAYPSVLVKSPATAAFAQFTAIYESGTGVLTDITNIAQLIETAELPSEYYPYALKMDYDSLPNKYHKDLQDIEDEITEVNGDIADINTELNKKAEYSIEQSPNLFNKDATDFISDYYISGNGSLFSRDGCKVTPLIEIEPNETYAYVGTNGGDGNYLRFVAADGTTALKPLNPNNDTEINVSSTTPNMLLKAPSTAKYAQFTCVYITGTGTVTRDITDTAQLIKSTELPTEYYPYYEREVIPLEHLPKSVEDMVNSGGSTVEVDDEISENGQNPVKGGAIYDAIVAANPLYKKTVRYDGDSIAAGTSATVLYGWSKLIGDRNENIWSSLAVHGGTITSGTYRTRVWKNGATTLYTEKEIFTKCYTNYDCTEGEQTIESQVLNDYIVVNGITYNFDAAASAPRHWICEGIDTLISQNKTADYIVFEGGTNDELLGNFTDENNPPARLGVFNATDYSGNYDKTTFLGALDYLFFKAATQYRYAKFGFIIAQKMGKGSTAANRRAIMGYIMRSCEKWGIPYINLWDESWLNPNLLAHCDTTQTVEQNIADGKLYIDSQHLTAYGYEAVSSKIEHWMRGL